MLNILGRLFSAIGVTTLARSILVGKKRLVLSMHDVIKQHRTDLTLESQYGITADEFDFMLSWLSERFTFLTPEEFFDTDASGILLTIDDGKANNHANALPVLEQHSVPAILFVSTQHVENPTDWLPYTRQCVLTQWESETDVPEEFAVEYFNGLTPQQLATCAQHPLITIGAHTVSHPFLTQCDDESLRQELTESKHYLEEIIDQPVNTFAYPTGDYDARVARTVQQVGYDYAFAVRPKKVGVPKYEIPRVFIGRVDVHYLDVKTSGLAGRAIHHIQQGSRT